LLALINDLLDLAKIDSGKAELHSEPVVCQGVVQEVMTALRPLAEAKGLRLEAQVPHEDLVVHTDRRRLLQIMLNLTNNAIKFTDQGQVPLELCRLRGENSRSAELSVVDTGIGIKPEDQAKLFSAFEQVNGLARERQGTGLGLFLSQRLAHLLGGQIHFHSEYGKGSRFSLVLTER
jgi:protein-histidine pros-kinase